MIDGESLELGMNAEKSPILSFTKVVIRFIFLLGDLFFDANEKKNTTYLPRVNKQTGAVAHKKRASCR